MRGRDVMGVVCAVLLAGGGVACQRAADGGGGATPGPSGSSSPGYGAVFLDAGECGTAGPEYREVPCGSEKAAAKVLARHAGAPAADDHGASCPAPTDFVLHVTGAGARARGYACMRNLEPPHPGDPGRGGGPRTRVGDCVRRAGAGRVEETACDGPAGGAPRYEVVAAVRSRAGCPSATDLFVDLGPVLGGSSPVGCARRR
ncbi:hypothetical protein ABT160_02280 [Streptomyces sp. NPDC001941]|uniref:hypothetical protein n=1 Tax=Streptomyces sp. NPDC001941 TaxID=3154659 RepID=UPI0033213302